MAEKLPSTIRRWLGGPINSVLPTKSAFTTRFINMTALAGGRMASVSIGQGGPGQKTRFGLPIDYAFEVPVTERRLQAAARALRENGFQVEVVDTPEDARKLVDGILPEHKSIFTGSSETVRLSGLDEDINRSGRFKSVRQELAKMDLNTQLRDMVRMGAAPDVIVGSVHAVTEDGRIVVDSASGSQLRPLRCGRREGGPGGRRAKAGPGPGDGHEEGRDLMLPERRTRA